MTDLTPTLRRLGDALEDAAVADLRVPATPTPSKRWRRLSPRLAIAAAVLAIIVPGVALAATKLIDTGDLAQSLPAGTLSLAGTEPTCTVVEQDVEYRCVLAHAPAPEISDWKGTVEPTVDATKHVNGGCRSLSPDGRTWACYIGEAAVREQIVSKGFLGEYAPTPGVG
jgi:hypothetical protein